MPRIKIDIDVSLFRAISDEEKAKITSILKSSELLSDDGTLGSGPSNVVDAQAAITDPQGFGGSIKKRFCKIGCNTAGAAAVAACTAATSGIGLAACLVATEIALQACLDEC